MARILVVEPVAQPGIDRLSTAHETEVRLGLTRQELIDALRERRRLGRAGRAQPDARRTRSWPSADTVTIGASGFHLPPLRGARD